MSQQITNVAPPAWTFRSQHLWDILPNSTLTVRRCDGENSKNHKKMTSLTITSSNCQCAVE